MDTIQAAETYDHVLKMEELRGQTSSPDQSEEVLRRDLAALYRILDHFGMTTLIFNHQTVRLPGPERHFLINPFGLRYDEITASNLVKIDIHGNIVGRSDYPVNPAGFFIHGAVHAVREDITCVMHTHTVAASAVTAIKGKLQYVDFLGAGLYERIAYHDFAGAANDESDCDALVQDLGDKNLMLMRNHGLLACGRTIAGAFNRMWNLEMACRAQVAALSMGVPLEHVPAAVAEKHAAVFDIGWEYELSFRAMVRLMEKRDPSFLE
jgi:ribulose-5-phosphate 4-epimerase/fuculose-1-phosphate aldolase